MKVGLIRHFEVIHTCSTFKFMTSEEFRQWQNGYNTAKTNRNPIDIDIKQWQICYASDLSRAVYTAEIIYGDGVIKTKLLREVDIFPPFETKIKLPFILWTIMGRIGWCISRRHMDRKRADDFISSIISEGEKNVLIVSHGAIMWYLRKALLYRGFTGPRFAKAKNGYLYTFEK